ncbi:unnamed protein product [Notodromas monacha]|uniref:Sodium-dependent nutrient amino acid transporter 1 n=1 Tax=Notodromas monacha TaxID=399045 RepID=A0A7R9GEK7_9CRUS|nr:unnamed protein product [Notodromas monacha]CAG0917978.1 unnamed protein product [Notodromas monacha]
MTRMEFCKAEYGETFVPGSAANICLGFDGLNRTFSTTIPAVDYQDRKVLGIYEMDDTFHTFTSYGSVMNRIFVCLFLAWLVSTVCVLKNINFAGKIVYVTCWLPILIAVVLLFRVLGLTGKENGMQAYVAPEYKYMYDGMVWFRAGATMMFSLGLGFGILPNLAAYNPFHGNFIRDAVGLSVLNSAYSVLIGFVAFSILGHLANVTGKELFSVVDSGVSLAFICYSSALARFTAVVRPLLSTVFFASLIFFGLSTQFSMFEAVLVAIMDVYPSLESHRKLLTLGLGFLGFLMGVPMTFQGGAHMLKLLDLYVPTTPVMVILLCQAIMFVHVYGWQNLMKDWNLMLGPPSKFEKLFRMYVFLSLAFVAPVMITHD